MNAESSVFAVLSIKPHSPKELSAKLPYSKHAVQKALGALVKNGLVTRRKEDGRTVAEISDNYRAQKLREIYIKSLSHGIDPERLTRESTVRVWKQLAEARSLRDLQKRTGLSYPWVRDVLEFLVDSGLASYVRRKPVIAALDPGHELNALLRQLLLREDEKRKVYYSGSVPFERLVRGPSEIERILYERIDSPLAIRKTGFQIRGEGKLIILESVEDESGLEDLFLREIQTPEGAEDFCVFLISSGKLDYGRLLSMAREKGIVNAVGCYLDILRSCGMSIGEEVLEGFRRNLSRRRSVFLKDERSHGKGGWEGEYEERWNVDLYLDIGAIRHGVRSYGLP
ncbi:MAG: MarR family transcriptional regulator [Thermoplasmata archaeon]